VDYLLDTNILVVYSHNLEIADKIEKELQIFNGINDVAISIVTLGEIDSLIKQYKYGDKRKQRIGKMLDQLYEIDINIKEIIDRYGDIDAYSQGRLEGKPLRSSSRNMGKNDLWIAATASLYDMTLVTADKDFKHLDGAYLKLKYLDIKKYKKN